MFGAILAACERRTPKDGPLGKWERLAVWLYATTKGPWFKDINVPLRERRVSSVHIATIIDCLCGALKKLPPYVGRVWRGIRVSNLDEFLRDYMSSSSGVGAEVTWLAFGSSTLDERQAVVGNVLFIIQSHDGRQLGAYADLAEEQEVLFAPLSRFRVLGLERTPTRAIISLEQVAPLSGESQ